VDGGVLELLDLAAAGADQVIVRPVGRTGIKSGVGIPELPSRGESGLPQELEGPVHRDQADAAVLGLDPVVELLGTDVPAGGEEGADDAFPLARGLEARAGQEVGEALEASVGIGHV
jgi:hypothetical protein